MVTPDKDLEAVREQYDAVAGRLSKLALVSLSTILLLVIPFARACRQSSGEDVNRRVREINQLSEKSSSCPRLSYIFLLFPGRPGCDNAYAHILNSAGDGAEGADGTVDEAEDSPDAAQLAGGQQSTPEEAQHLAAEEEAKRRRAEALTRQRALEAALDADARQLFTVKPSLLAADIEFDLRYWIFALPFVVWLSGIYFGILRKKLDVLRNVATARLTAADQADVTVVDRLAFTRQEAGRAAPFLSQPGRLEAAAYGLSVTLALAYLAASGVQLWQYWSPRVMLYLIETVLLVSYFSLAYTLAVEGAMDEQVKGLLGIETSRGRIEQSWRLLKRWGRTVSRLGRFKPRMSLLTGSLLLFSTLFLSLATSCEDLTDGYEFVPRKGYELALGRNEVFWYSGYTGGAGAIYLGRWYYLVCLGLALFTLVLVGIRLTRGSHLLHSVRAAAFAYRLSVTLALCMLADVTFVSFFTRLCFTFFDQPLMGDAVRVLAFAVPATLWNFAALSRRPERRAKWERWRNVIAALYLPGVVLGAQEMYLHVMGGYTGVPVFFVGLVLLAFGYAEVYSRAVVSSSAARQTDKPYEGR